MAVHDAVLCAIRAALSGIAEVSVLRFAWTARGK